MNPHQFLLTLRCPNRPGIVAAVSNYIFESGGDIHEAQQYNDEESNLHFMRVVYSVPPGTDPQSIERGFDPVAARFDMDWSHRAMAKKPRVLVLVSKFDHCLVDVLYRWKIGELNMDLVGIVANHPASTYAHIDLADVPFHYLPVTSETKQAQEARILSLVESEKIDLVVLARYMQILSDSMTAALDGRCINIHHSFLPGFKGARPYHQAHARGVKLIGATAHYVTADLDEGPIIEQSVERVSHSDSAESLARKGRDIECKVLSRALALHLDGRVFGNGSRTVVFRD